MSAEIRKSRKETVQRKVEKFILETCNALNVAEWEEHTQTSGLRPAFESQLFHMYTCDMGKITFSGCFLICNMRIMMPALEGFGEVKMRCYVLISIVLGTYQVIVAIISKLLYFKMLFKLGHRYKYYITVKEISFSFVSKVNLQLDFGLSSSYSIISFYTFFLNRQLDNLSCTCPSRKLSSIISISLALKNKLK